MNTKNSLILIEGAATYERILTEVREVEADEGLRHIQDFLKIYPDFGRAHNDVAVMYYQAGNSLKALAHYEKAHKLEPANVVFRKNLADFYFVELEWTGEAINTYLDILKDNPFDIEALNALGTISQKIGRREQARQYFTRTLQIDVNNFDAAHGLQQLPPAAVSAVKQIGQPAPAAPYAPAPPAQIPEPIPTPEPVQPPEPLEPPVSTQPTTAPAAPVTSSFQDLFRSIAAEPKPSAVDQYQDAVNLANNGKLDEAMALLKTIIGSSPDSAIAHNDLGVLCQKTGDLPSSRYHHEAAVRLQPANTTFAKNLADLLYCGFGAFEEALDIYVRLFAENRYDVELLKAIAHICLEIDRQEDARFFLEQLLSIKPWDLDAAESLRTIGAVPAP